LINNYSCKILFSIILAFNLLPEKSIAQSVLYQSKLDSVVVSIGRVNNEFKYLPYSASIIDSNQLMGTLNPLSLKDVLISTPGVTVNNRFNLAQGDRILIRGIGSRAQFGVQGIKIFLDDIPLTFPDGQSQLNNLNLSYIKNIEIVRGPNSSLYGNASGGVISIKSNLVSNENLYFKPEINYGSFGFWKFGVDLSGNILSGNSGVNIYSSNYDGFRKHSDSRMYGANLLSNQIISDNFNLKILLNYFDAPYLLNPSSLNKEDAENDPTKVRESILNSGTAKKVNQLQTGITLNYNFSDFSSIKSTLYAIKRNLLNSIPSRIIDLDRLSYGIRNTFQYKNNSVNIITGFDLEVQDDTRLEYRNEGVENNWNGNPSELFDNLLYGEELLNQKELVFGIGPFIRAEFEIIENLLISGGVRYDYFNFKVEGRDKNKDIDKKNMDKISPALGFNYSISDNINIYSNFTSSFQTPTTNELSNTASGEGGFNPALKPEVINSLEAGIKGEVSSININFDAAIFLMDITDQLIVYQNIFEESYYVNSGRSENKGLELSLNWTPSEFLRTGFTYSNNNMIFKDYQVEYNNQSYQLNGKYLPGIPKHQFYYYLSLNVLEKLFAQASLNYTSEMFVNDLNGPLPGLNISQNNYINEAYTLVGLTIIYKHIFGFGNVNLKFGVENLFNSRYNGSIVPNAFGNNFYEPGSDRAFFVALNFTL